MRCLVMFVTAVSVLFLLKSLKFDLCRVLRWKVSLNQTDSKPFLRAKRSQRQIAGGLNWQASIPWVCIVDFQADDYFELWQDQTRRGEKRQRTPDRRLGRRKLQIKCNLSFVFQRSFADQFSVSYACLGHEQHVSLMLPLLCCQK